jgi:hypothetical protein
METKKVKTGGRRKGSKNVLTQDLKNSITSFLNHNFKEVEQMWLLLEPRDRISMYTNWMKIVIPPPVAVSSQEDFFKGIGVKIGFIPEEED